MKISISSLSQAGETGMALSFTERPVELGENYQGYEFPGDLSFTGSISVSGRESYVLEGTLTTGYRTTCARCLTPVDGTIELPLREVFIPESAAAPKLDLTQVDTELEADEAELAYSYKGHQLDLTDALLHNLFLAMPARVLCQEDCAGLCQICGADRNLKPCNCEAEARAEAEKTNNPFAALATWEKQL